MADPSLGAPACIAVLDSAIAGGCNVIDTAPSYEDGLSETVVGHVARARRRDALFVIDKIDRIRAEVIPQLDQSLFRLRIETIDLAVFHGVSTLADLERLLAPGGGFAQIEVARREKLCRFRGISTHHPSVLARALEEGCCDVVMFPLGPHVHPRYRELLGAARERGVGTVCFKTFGAGKLLLPTTGYSKPLPAEAPPEARRAPTRFDAARCVRYTLTLDPDVTLLGMSTREEVETALDAARTFTPMTKEELASAEADAALEVQGKGKVWWDPEDAAS